MLSQYRRYIVLLGFVFSAEVCAQGNDTVMLITASYHTPAQDAGVHQEAVLVGAEDCEAEKAKLEGVATVLRRGQRQDQVFAELWVEYKVQCAAFEDFAAVNHCLPPPATKQSQLTYGLTITARPGPETWQCENNIRLVVN